MNSCIDFEKIFAAADGGTLTAEEMRHIENCAECSALYRDALQMKEDAAALADVKVPDTLVPGVMRRVKDARRAKLFKMFSGATAGVLCAAALTFAFFGNPASPLAAKSGRANYAADSYAETSLDNACTEDASADSCFDAEEYYVLTIDKAEGEVYRLAKGLYDEHGLDSTKTYIKVFVSGGVLESIQICDSASDDVLAKAVAD